MRIIAVAYKEAAIIASHIAMGFVSAVFAGVTCELSRVSVLTCGVVWLCTDV